MVYCFLIFPALASPDYSAMPKFHTAEKPYYKMTFKEKCETRGGLYHGWIDFWSGFQEDCIGLK